MVRLVQKTKQTRGKQEKCVDGTLITLSGIALEHHFKELSVQISTHKSREGTNGGEDIQF